jgi:hypothetical protein
VIGDSVIVRLSFEGLCNLQSDIHEIQSEIQIIERDKALYDQANYVGRAEAIEYIESAIIERIERLPLAGGQAKDLAALKQYAETVKNQCEAIDENLFRKLRADIRSGLCTGAELKRQIVEYTGYAPTDGEQVEVGYDALDTFINGLLLIGGAPRETKEREPEMVFYQPTPARVVFELVEKANFQREDVLYDVGSGLGLVSILGSLLGEVKAKGVEFEPAYCDYARRCAEELNLAQVEFLCVDARDADYSAGTVFFMYTPFEGRLLQDVLDRLKAESQEREIRVATYGPCTLSVSRQSWLTRVGYNGDSIYRLAMFRNA